MDKKLLKKIGDELDYFNTNNDDDSQVWMIKVNGKVFIPASGKTGWRTKAFAKLAFHESFKESVCRCMPDIDNLYSKEKLNKLKEILSIMEEEKIIEFVCLNKKGEYE